MHLKEAYNKTLETMRMTSGGGEKFPEVPVEKVWEDIVKKLRDYSFDVGTYGSLNEYAKKMAYFFHASIQGSGAYPGAADTVKLVAERGVLHSHVEPRGSFHATFVVDEHFARNVAPEREAIARMNVGASGPCPLPPRQYEGPEARVRRLAMTQI